MSPVQSGCQQGQGRPAHVLLTFAEYKKITGGHTKIADLLKKRFGELLKLQAKIGRAIECIRRD